MGKQLLNFITGGCESSAPFVVIYKAGETGLNQIYLGPSFLLEIGVPFIQVKSTFMELHFNFDLHMYRIPAYSWFSLDKFHYILRINRHIHFVIRGLRGLEEE